MKKLTKETKKQVAGGFYSKPGHPDYDREPGKMC